MDSERPQLSITLPRNFQFHYRDGNIPQTPEPGPQPEELQPPPPPRQTLKVRRRRTTMVQQLEEAEHINSRVPVPTIEAPEHHSEISSDLPMAAPVQDHAYLSPGFSYTRMLSPPKTPVAQVRTVASYDGPQDWDDLDESSQSETSSRPTSSAGFSDSSISSYGSIESFMSQGGSCTSPGNEMTDPYLAFSPDVKYGQLASPVPAVRPAKRLKLRATFTEDMDTHLWMTYMKYLQDPKVTPFKALPGTVPPNGVCHRVARMARKTWPESRTSRLGVRRSTQYQVRSDTPDTIRPLRSGSNTPMARISKSLLRYPSEKQCRKRLRDLAKQKPTLAVHYQRLLRRSPSPLQSSPPSESTNPSIQPQPLSSPFSQNSGLFSTRDMNVSLATSTAASMQMGNPLSQLSSGAPRPAPRTWSNRASAHQKSQSLHIGLGLGLRNVLGSPFQAMSGMTDVSMNQGSNAQTWHAHSSSAQPPRLGSPFQLHTPRPISRVFKRRALNSSFEDRSRNRGNSFVDELFGAPAEYSHRRVRSRGFSLGDTVDGVRRLPVTTSPFAEADPFVSMAPGRVRHAHHSPAVLAEVQGQATVRLGSPFGSRPSNTFPRASVSHAFEPPASFEQRFAAMPSDPAHLHRS